MNWGMSEDWEGGWVNSGVFGPFLKSFSSLIEKPHWNFEAALIFLDGHCDVDNYYTFWAPSNMFSVGIYNRHIARTMTSLFPSHELHLHQQHQLQLAPSPRQFGSTPELHSWGGFPLSAVFRNPSDPQGAKQRFAEAGEGSQLG